MNPDTITAAVEANRAHLAACFTEAKALIRELGLRPHHQALVLLAVSLLKSGGSAKPGLKAALKEAIAVLKAATGAKLDALDTVAVVFLAGELAGMVAPTLSDADADRVIQAILEQNGAQIASDVQSLGVEAVLGRIEQSVEKLSNGAALPAGKVIEIRSYLEDRARWAKPRADAEGGGEAPEANDAPADGQPVTDNDTLSSDTPAG